MYFKLLLFLILVYAPFLACQPRKKMPNPYINPAAMTMDADGHEDCVHKIQMRDQHERKIHWKTYYRNKKGKGQQQVRTEKILLILAQKASQTKAQAAEVSQK